MFRRKRERRGGDRTPAKFGRTHVSHFNVIISSCSSRRVLFPMVAPLSALTCRWLMSPSLLLVYEVYSMMVEADRLFVSRSCGAFVSIFACTNAVLVWYLL